MERVWAMGDEWVESGWVVLWRVDGRRAGGMGDYWVETWWGMGGGCKKYRKQQNCSNLLHIIINNNDKIFQVNLIYEF